MLLHGIPPQGPAERARDFLTRQNAWFETMLAELKRIQSGEDDAELLPLIESHSVLAEERARYEREFTELAAEWRRVSEDLPAKTRAEIRALARRGEALTEEIRTEYERAIGVLGGQAKRVKGALDALSKGRNLLRRYAPGQSVDALFIDRKA